MRPRADFRRALRRVASALLAACVALTTAPALRAQGVDPRGDWRTLTTPHFRVHFRASLERQGRRAAADAERAWARLAAELTPPRGPVELVLTDNVDFTNGFASTFPSNRIVAYAQPPVDVASLRFYDDWSELLLTHELTHVFHLDRARGIWRLGQRVFGRHPALFPNAYGPAWLTEGLAVHFESKLTGAGRLVGTEHALLARTAAADGGLPRLDQLSLESSVFPGGQQAYAYGSLVVDYLARHGDGGLRAFVDRSSGLLIPYRIDAAARRSVGLTFTDAWRRWRDSVEQATDVGAVQSAAAGGWRDLTRDGWYAAYPRWADARTLLYGANVARAVPAAHRLTLDGRQTRAGRRNSLSPNVPIPGGPLAGGTLFAQLEYADPFTVRSDLWVQAAGTPAPDFGAASRGQRRLTVGARLSHPDVRSDGGIVAVQIVAGTTRLVRLTATAGDLRALTSTAADTQWAEPRWSPDGRQVAAVRLTRGGQSAIVVLDTAGHTLAVVGDERGVSMAPSWTPDGRTIVWSSDRSGTPQPYGATLDCAGGAVPSAEATPTCVGAVRRLDAVRAGVTQPVPSPDGRTLAALQLRGDGLHVAVRSAVASMVAAARDVAQDDAPLAPSTYPAASRIGAAGSAEGSLRRYSPWRTLVPRYWTPIVAAADGRGTLLGAATSGRDMLGRHAYAAELDLNLDTRDVEGGASYRLTRWARPFVDLSASQSWQYDPFVVRRGSALDTVSLDRRTRIVGTSLVFSRPRYRTSASLSIGAAYEARDYRSTLAAVETFADTTVGRSFPSVSVGGAWSNARRPLRSISPEDGVALAFSAQQRWQDGSATRGPSRRALGVARTYKSLDLPGFSHHALALRVAGGAADRRATSEYSAGGVSGSAASLLPGVTVGDPSRPFGARGFPAGAQRGLRAAAATLEYRAPLALPARGVALLPVFLDRVSVTAFADAASAWCPADVDRRRQPLCRRTATGAADLLRSPVTPRWLTSVGAELNLDAALQYDVGYRVRLGVAVPTAQRARAASRVSAYGTLGLAF